MRFLLYEDLRMKKGIPYSDRQLKQLEAKGTFPKRVPLAAGGSVKGWPETIITTFENLVAISRSGSPSGSVASA